MLVVISFSIKISLLFYKFYFAYTTGDATIVNPDEWAYLEKARDVHLNIKIGGHWLYEWMNWAVYWLLRDEYRSYLTLSLYNITLSLIVPFFICPVIRHLSQDENEYNRVFFIFSVFFLFWPASIFSSVANLKEMTLVILAACSLSLLVTWCASASFPKRLAGVILLCGCVFLIFSTRSYFSVFLGVSIIVYFLSSKLSLVRKLWGIAFVVLLLTTTGLFQYAWEFLKFENNWLLNPEAMARVNTEILESASFGILKINNTPTSFARGSVKFLTDPIPNLDVSSVFWFLLMVQTGAGVFFLAPFIMGAWRLKKEKLAWTLFLLLGLSLLFYSVAQTFSGARQRFATYDIYFLIILAFGLNLISKLSPEKKGLLWGYCTMALLVNIAALVFTSKAFF